MFSPDVPIMNSNIHPATRGQYLEQFRAAQVGRVWIALDRISLFERGDSMARLRSNIDYFQAAGYEVGVWVQAYGFGDPLPKGAARDWTRICSLSGKQAAGDAFCPEDERFTAAYCDWVVDIAHTGARLIMLDDDLCLSVRPGIGCFCDRHLALLEQKIGRKPALDQIFVGGRNPDRDAFLAVMGETNRKFCRAVREAVDRIDPTIRVGYCAGYTSWDLEGADPLELSRILAGKTKPFFRFTGAPYWVEKNRFDGQTLASVIECARLQLAWSRQSGAEVFAEADSYPRPCYNVPAMLIENFDLAMHAAGVKSLKYLFDYYASPQYERQYWRIHCRNLPFYERLETAFRDTAPCGVRVYRPTEIIADAELPNPMDTEKSVMTRSAFSMTAAMLAAQGIPVCYEGESPFAAAFGEEARYLDLNHQKILLDLPAALALHQKGVDVGLEQWLPAEPPTMECFGEEWIRLMRTAPQAVFHALTLKAGAVACGRFDNGAVSAYTYGKFMVLNFDARAVGEGSDLFRSYIRGTQLRGFFENSYPAIVGFADVYCLCHQSERGQVVLFQNHSADPIFDFAITLPKPCKKVRFERATGACGGDRIEITSEFSPGASILLEVEY